MEALRNIPPVNDILLSTELAGFGPVLNQPFVQSLLGELLAQTRERLRSDGTGTTRERLTQELARDLARRIDALLGPSLRHVINATGVVLHTNLGRAPLSRAALEHAGRVSAGYSNLEFDLETGRRGKRDAHVEGLLRGLLDCEAAIVVNNNAAAVLLALNTLADGGEVVASRGEQVEIGGSFRIPDVMTKSGAVLREVGATNRTRIADYEAAIGPETRLLLRVHPSNFRTIGFTERPGLDEFVELGRRHRVPTFDDLGSGCMLDMARLGVDDEPLPADSLRAGVDLLCFSGDKLLGGPQAGILAGKRDLVDRLRRNSLFRALRVDKLTLATLEVVLLAYLRGELREIPVWRALLESEDVLKTRAEALAERLGGTANVRSMASLVGGGSVPEVDLPSWGLVIDPAPASAESLQGRLRGTDPPVIVRIEDDHVLLDLRTVADEEEDSLVSALRNVMIDQEG